MIRSIATAAVLGLAACQPAMAQAPVLCDQTEKVHDILLNQAGMNLLFVGLHHEGTVIIEAFGGGESEGFTIIATHPNGVSCMVVKGDYYMPATAPAAGDPA